MADDAAAAIGIHDLENPMDPAQNAWMAETSTIDALIVTLMRSVAVKDPPLPVRP